MCRVRYFPQERRRPNEKKKKIWRRRVGEGEGGGEEECAGRWGAEGSLEGEGGAANAAACLSRMCVGHRNLYNWAHYSELKHERSE